MTKPELSKEDLMHLKLGRELESLVANPAWKTYCDIIRSHIKDKEAEVWTPSENIDHAMKQNAAKGAVLMGRLLLGLPSSIIDVAKDIRDRHRDEDDTSNDPSTTVGQAP